MADSKKQDLIRSNNGGDGDEILEREAEVARTTDESSLSSSSSSSGSLADRLSEILVDESDGDLLLQQSDRDNNFLQFLQALDLQHIGACRADQRLKPFLKMNTSSEDCILSHLSQHFKASEVGLLARCLCVPLVSLRVGKVEKQGSMLCPTSERGSLNLTLLPSSDLRISFVGDNGQTERLATLNDTSDCFAVTAEEIPADQSGRSFLMKLPDGGTLYFWCSEKSKLLGNDLLLKMKDLLRRKPTLAELTGISELRLESFAARLRSYLVGPSVDNTQTSSTTLFASWTDIRSDATEGGENTQFSSTSMRSLRTRQGSTQTMKGHTPYQGSLSPRPSSFKEGLPRSIASLRSTSRDKIRRRGDLHLPLVGSAFMTDTILNLSEKGKPSEGFSTNSVSPLSFLESLGNCSFQESPSATAQIPPIGALFSPYYCWCPPCTSPSMASIAKLPTSLAEPFSLPPLSTLLPATGTPNMLPQIPPLDLSNVSSLEFPALSDPLTRLSFAKQSTQLSTFTPLMCDPIVHIPVIDFCSSGQGYLVSAGPGIATSIPPLHPKLTMIPESESMVDKGARETLRLLIGGSSGQSSASLMGVFPAFLNDEDKQGVVVAGSRGLYSGMSDINAIVNSFAAVGLASVSERSTIGVSLKNSYNTGATSADALERTSNCLDFPDSAFMSGDEEKD